MKSEIQKTFVIFFLLFVKCYGHNMTKRALPNMDEATMPTPLIINKYGYPSELHSVTTEDGYKLEIHRIPYGKKSPPCRRRSKPAVLLMHDIISSSSDFIINGPDRSLGYLLADSGFDVWLGNVRGNRYSRNHRTLSPSFNNFWDFSFHEMGSKDLPVIIDYILNKTQQDKITYLGFSMGTTIYYVLMSEHPEYNNKITASFQLSPVVYLDGMKSPILRFFSIFTNPIALFLDIIGVGEFLPKWELMTQIGHMLCKNGDITQVVCTHILFILSGFNHDNLDTEMFPVYMGHTPAGASSRTFIHYGQIVQTGVFRKYNMGLMENLLKFGSIKPPEYNLQVHKVPIYMFYAKDEWFATAGDVDKLYNKLPKGIATKILVNDPNFQHIDFVFGKNAKEQIYDQLIPMMKQHSPFFQLPTTANQEPRKRNNILYTPDQVKTVQQYTIPQAPYDVTVHQPSVEMTVHQPSYGTVVHQPSYGTVVHQPSYETVVHQPSYETVVHQPSYETVVHQPSYGTVVHQPVVVPKTTYEVVPTVPKTTYEVVPAVPKTTYQVLPAATVYQTPLVG